MKQLYLLTIAMFQGVIKEYLYVFIISMLPVVELRGAIPVGYAMGIELIPNFLVSVVGNLLPVPFILLLVPKVIAWLGKSRVKFFNKIAEFLVNKVQKNTHKITKYATMGLFLFVAIPLPGTGAWTGSLIAAMIDMPKKKSFISVLLGVLMAGIIVSAICYGAIDGLMWLVR